MANALYTHGLRGRDHMLWVQKAVSMPLEFLRVYRTPQKSMSDIHLTMQSGSSMRTAYVAQLGMPAHKRNIAHMQFGLQLKRPDVQSLVKQRTEVTCPCGQYALRGGRSALHCWAAPGSPQHHTLGCPGPSP